MKKLLVIFGLSSIALFAQCSNTSYGNGFTCIQQTGAANGGTGSTRSITFSSPTTAGNEVVVFASVCADAGCTSTNASGITLTVANGAGDTAIQATNAPFLLTDGQNGSTTAVKYTAWVFTNVSATTTFTVTATGGTPNFLALYASEWTGISDTSPWDGGAGTQSPNGTQTSATVNIASTTNATDLILGYIGNWSGANITPGSGFTEIGEPLPGQQHQAKSVTTAGAQSCTWTMGSTAWQAACVALKATGSSSPPRKRVIVNN